MKKIPYGISDYEKLINTDCYYVDKTMYLEKLESFGEVLTYLRPRRFGKTLFTSMMYYYYDINSKNKFDTLFKDTYVYNNPTKNKNNYYVLKFDFSSVTTSDKDKIVLEKEFNDCLYMGIGLFLNHYNLNYSIDKDVSPASMIRDFITFFAKLNTNKKLYIIIDEYDNFTNAILDGRGNKFKEIVGKDSFLKAFYAAIKFFTSNGIIDRVFITGVCSITLDSMTSGFNISTDITNYLEFNSMVGLTHNEVKNLLKDVNTKERKKIFDIMVENYDGYLFNSDAKEKVFNATLVMYFLNNYYRYKTIPYNLFDKNIISNFDQIRNIIGLQDNKLYKDILDNLFYNRGITCHLKENFNLDSEISNDDIVSLLYYFGYLTIDSDVSSYSKLYKIPNKVIDRIFNEYYLYLLMSYNIILSNDIIEKAGNEIKNEGKIDILSNYISELLSKADNRIFIGFKEKDIQLLYYGILDRYLEFNTVLEEQVNNNFIDLMIYKKKNLSNYDIMIEFKYIKKKEYNKRLLNEKRKEAIEQINKYSDNIMIDKDKLRKYVVIFVGYELKVLEEI